MLKGVFREKIREQKPSLKGLEKPSWLKQKVCLREEWEVRLGWQVVFFQDGCNKISHSTGSSYNVTLTPPPVRYRGYGLSPHNWVGL